MHCTLDIDLSMFYIISDLLGIGDSRRSMPVRVKLSARSFNNLARKVENFLTKNPEFIPGEFGNKGVCATEFSTLYKVFGASACITLQRNDRHLFYFSEQAKSLVFVYIWWLLTAPTGKIQWIY